MTLQRSDVTVSKTGYEHRVVTIKRTGKLVGHLMKTWGDYPSHTGWDVESLDGSEMFFAHQADAVRWLIRKYEERGNDK